VTYANVAGRHQCTRSESVGSASTSSNPCRGDQQSRHRVDREVFLTSELTSVTLDSPVDGLENCALIASIVAAMLQGDGQHVGQPERAAV